MFLNRNASPLSRLGLMASAALILGGAAVSIPVTYAEAHPHDELAGAPHTSNSSTKSTRSIMMVDVDNDGESKTYKFDIRTDNDDFTAYRLDTKTGKKTKIRAKDIEGFDARKLKEGGWSFQVKDDGNLKFLDTKETREWARNNPGSQPQMPPMPPSTPNLTSTLSDVRSLTLHLDASEIGNIESELAELKRELEDMGDLSEMKRSEIIKSLESLETLKALKGRTGGNVFVKRKFIDADGNVTVLGSDEDVQIFVDGAKRKASEQQSEALVEAASRLIEQAEANSKTTSMSYDAQQKLKVARKALERAQAALEEN